VLYISVGVKYTYINFDSHRNEDGEVPMCKLLKL
jgi:hypothetical protein